MYQTPNCGSTLSDESEDEKLIWVYAFLPTEFNAMNRRGVQIRKISTYQQEFQAERKMTWLDHDLECWLWTHHYCLTYCLRNVCHQDGDYRKVLWERERDSQSRIHPRLGYYSWGYFCFHSTQVPVIKWS